MTTLATFVPDRLLAGNQQCQTKAITVLAGANVLRGSVVGKITLGTIPTTATAAEGNTGGNTIGSVVGKRRTKVGTYTIKCVAVGQAAEGGSVAEAAEYEVINPDGVKKGMARVGVAYADDEIGFLITDAGATEAVGDTYTIVVPAGSGKYKLADKAAVDGSGVAAGIVADEKIAAASADAVGIMYITGQFNEDALIFATGNTADDHRADLRIIDINLLDDHVAA